MRALFVFLCAAAAYAAPPLATLSGTVVDARDGKPLAGARVDLFFARGTQTTGPDGRFEFANLTPDSYSLTVQSAGYTNLQTPAILLSAGQTIANYVIRMQPGAIVSGRVVNHTGNISVTLTHADSPGYVASASTSDGRFELNGLAAGRYKLYAQADDQSPTFYPSARTRALAEVIELSPGARREGVEIVLQQERRYSVRGRFAGPIPPGERIRLQRDRLDGEPGAFSSSSYLDAEGRFDIQLSPGDYRLKVVNSPRAGQSYRDLGFREIAVTDANLNGIVIQPIQLRSVRIRFRHSSPVPNPSIVLNPTAAIGSMQHVSRQPDGTIVAENLAPNIYSFFIGGLPAGAYVRSILAAGADITNSGLDLITGTATDLEIVLGADGATLSGRVLDSANQPVHDGTVYLYRPNATRPARDLSHFQATVNAAGRYTISAIAPGEYEVYYRGADKPIRLATVRLAPRQNQSLSLSLP